MGHWVVREGRSIWICGPKNNRHQFRPDEFSAFITDEGWYNIKLPKGHMMCIVRLSTKSLDTRNINIVTRNNLWVDAPHDILPGAMIDIIGDDIGIIFQQKSYTVQIGGNVGIVSMSFEKLTSIIKDGNEDAVATLMENITQKPGDDDTSNLAAGWKGSFGPGQQAKGKGKVRLGFGDTTEPCPDTGDIELATSLRPGRPITVQQLERRTKGFYKLDAETVVHNRDLAKLRITGKWEQMTHSLHRPDHIDIVRKKSLRLHVGLLRVPWGSV